jgi:hypothetical protein
MYEYTRETPLTPKQVHIYANIPPPIFHQLGVLTTAGLRIRITSMRIRDAHSEPTSTVTLMWIRIRILIKVM